MIAGTYNAGLVALSVAIGIVASYAAFNLGERVSASGGRRPAALGLPQQRSYRPGLRNLVHALRGYAGIYPSRTRALSRTDRSPISGVRESFRASRRIHRGTRA